jgi:hypothetical protein
MQFILCSVPLPSPQQKKKKICNPGQIFSAFFLLQRMLFQLTTSHLVWWSQGFTIPRIKNYRHKYTLDTGIRTLEPSQIRHMHTGHVLTALRLLHVTKGAQIHWKEWTRSHWTWLLDTWTLEMCTIGLARLGMYTLDNGALTQLVGTCTYAWPRYTEHSEHICTWSRYIGHWTLLHWRHAKWKHAH